jgi:hypothetical protein
MNTQPGAIQLDKVGERKEGNVEYIHYKRERKQNKTNI